MKKRIRIAPPVRKVKKNPFADMAKDMWSRSEPEKVQGGYIFRPAPKEVK